MASYAPLYDYLVVIDFEATCDEGENPVVTRANQEIIEFPWVVVDTIHGQVVDSRQIYVKPEWSKSLTPFCTQLTGITNETLANAGTLREAVQQFDTYVYTSFIAANKSFCLITDGAWDLKYQLRGEAAAKGIKLAAHYSRFFDLRNEFVQLHKNAAHVTGLQGMLNYLGLTMEGRHHSGISDCMNISKIVARLIKDGHRFQSPETIPDNFVPEASYKDFNKSGVNTAMAAGMAAIGGVQNIPMSTGPESVVKLRGLPWSATEDDITRFFAPLQPVGVHLTQNHHGRPTGEGYVEFANENDATSALEYHKRSIGSRYVEVFKVPRSEMDRAVHPNVSGDGGAVLRMRGLPYNSTTGDISAFFGGFDIIPNGIYIVVGRDGRATGEAYVEFSSDMHAEQALKAKHREKIGTRYIELFRSSKAELNHVMNPYGGYTDSRVYDPNHNVSELVSIRMLGLPYSASENDVINFFAGLNIVPGGVHFVYNNNDRPTGEGFVEFATTEDARRALERHKMTMGSRYIELFRCTKGEMLMDLGVGAGLGGGMGAMGGMGGMNAMGGLGGLGAMGMGGMGMGGMGGMGAMGGGMGAMGGMGGWNQAQPQQLSDVYALLQSQMMNTMNTMGMANAYGGWPAAQSQSAPAPVAPPASRAPPMGMGGGGSGSVNVKLRGLPYHATVGDIAAFFNGYDIQRHAIALGSTPDGRPSGEAWVQFGSPDEAARAVRERNRAHMGSRYVELFLA